MTAITEKTWTNKASAQKAFSRAGLDKAEFVIAECNGEFCILEIERDDEHHDEAVNNVMTALHGPAASATAIEPTPMTEQAIVAQAFALPTPPDFSKPSHAPYRKRLALMVAAAEAGDAAFLAALQFKVERSSQKIMARYRDACLRALGA